MKRFLRSVSRSRPSQPRYNFTWDPLLVLNYLEKFFPHSSIPLSELSKKILMLLMLITGHRLQTIALIKTDSIIIGPDEIQIFITDRIKTSGTRAEQPVLHIPYFLEKPELCVASALLHYLERTANLRENSLEYLFISLKEPYKNISKQTLARWIKNVLKEAGVNVSLFSAHSVRHASTSMALRNGISVDVIRKTAGWSASSNTFAKFYNRPLKTSVLFANAILNKSKNC